MKNDQIRNEAPVILSEVEERRGKTLCLLPGILRLRFASLRMTICHSDFVIHSAFDVRYSTFSL